MKLTDLIEEAQASTRYGTITITLKKNDGVITTVDTTKITRHKVDGNAQALTMIGSMLKLMAEAKETGDLTVTVHVVKGSAAQLMTHDFQRAFLSGDKYTH